MTPETINKLRKQPAYRELLVYLAQELLKLDTLDGLSGMSFTERAYETTSRLRAKEALTRLLEPLLGVGDKPTGIDPKEYVV